MAKTRVHELAKLYNVESKFVLEKLKEMGEFVKSPSSTIELPVEMKFKKEYGDQLKAVAETPPRPLRPRRSPPPRRHQPRRLRPRRWPRPSPRPCEAPAEPAPEVEAPAAAEVVEAEKPEPPAEPERVAASGRVRRH